MWGVKNKEVRSSLLSDSPVVPMRTGQCHETGRFRSYIGDHDLSPLELLIWGGKRKGEGHGFIIILMSESIFWGRISFLARVFSVTLPWVSRHPAAEQESPGCLTWVCPPVAPGPPPVERAGWGILPLMPPDLTGLYGWVNSTVVFLVFETESYCISLASLIFSMWPTVALTNSWQSFWLSLLCAGITATCAQLYCIFFVYVIQCLCCTFHLPRFLPN